MYLFEQISYIKTYTAIQFTIFELRGSPKQKINFFFYLKKIP